jgi:hypothetical protein
MSNRVKGRIFAGAGLLVFVASLVMAGPEPAHGHGGPDVTIVNSSENPVPVSVSGSISGSVTIENTPDVNVVNTPNVSVTNTPSVNVANTPNVHVSSLPSVTVGSLPAVSINPAANSVQVENVVFVREAKTPVQGSHGYEVPEGKRLVIESVFMRAVIGNNGGNSYFSPTVSTSVNGTFISHPLPVSSVLHYGLTDLNYYTASLQVRLYADAGTTVTAQFNFTGNGISSQHFSFTGYLEDVI